METRLPIKRLFRIAIYTSTAIGIITMGPVMLSFFSFTNFNIEQPLLLKLIGLVVAGISLLVFFFWTINIFLSYFIIKHSFSARVKKITKYLWSYIICFVMFISIKLIFNYFILSPALNNAILNWKIKEFGIHNDIIGVIQNKEGFFQYLILVFMVISINTVVIIIQDLVLLLEKKTIIESENIQLKIKNIEAANQRLKQQLQPHFLFNSLNVLKTLIKKQPDDAETYLKRLSDFLRASVSFDNVNTVKFEDELKLSMDYLEMQKIRFGNAIQFEISIPDEVKAGIIPIFSFNYFLKMQ